MTGQTAKADLRFELLTIEDARRFLVQGLWTARFAAWTDESLTAAVLLARGLLEENTPLLPLGVLADLQTILLGNSTAMQTPPSLLPNAMMKRYEHDVLGRLAVDPLIDRAASALQRYTAKDRHRGTVFAVKQIIERLHLGGICMASATLRDLPMTVSTVLVEGSESIEADGPMPELISIMERLIASTRKSAEFLAREDVIALEHGTALMDLATFVAHRQVLPLCAQFESRLPARPPLPLPGRREIPTAIRDDDHYPVGGYASITTRGSMESLLQSQLALMESDGEPDLFDAKYVRDELFYYSRDDNRFLRKHRAFAIHFAGDLASARVKDVTAPAQRLVLAMACVLAAVRRLGQWLSHESLEIAISFDAALVAEQRLMAILLRDWIGRKLVNVECVATESINSAWYKHRRAMKVTTTEAEAKEWSTLRVSENPRLTEGSHQIDAAWDELAIQLLKLWI